MDWFYNLSDDMQNFIRGCVSGLLAVLAVIAVVAPIVLAFVYHWAWLFWFVIVIPLIAGVCCVINDY